MNAPRLGLTDVYAYGLQWISVESAGLAAVGSPSFYGYDGHGNVRFLTKSAGTITDTPYGHDAFGAPIASTGTTTRTHTSTAASASTAL